MQCSVIVCACVPVCVCSISCSRRHQSTVQSSCRVTLSWTGWPLKSTWGTQTVWSIRRLFICVHYWQRPSHWHYWETCPQLTQYTRHIIWGNTLISIVQKHNSYSLLMCLCLSCSCWCHTFVIPFRWTVWFGTGWSGLVVSCLRYWVWKRFLIV